MTLAKTRGIHSNSGNNNSVAEPEDFVIHKIVRQCFNRLRKHRYVEVGELLYRVRWYDYGPSEDAREPISPLPGSKIRWHRSSKGPALPATWKNKFKVNSSSFRPNVPREIHNISGYIIILHLFLKKKEISVVLRELSENVWIGTKHGWG